MKIKEREEVLQRVKMVLPAISDVGLNLPASLEVTNLVSNASV